MIKPTKFNGMRGKRTLSATRFILWHIEDHNEAYAVAHYLLYGHDEAHHTL